MHACRKPETPASFADNTFWLGPHIFLFGGNQGRDHRLIGNIIRPLPPNTVTGTTPSAQIGNHGCGGTNVGPYACTGCMQSTCALQASFLNRVPL